jgi:Acetyltransferase (GNAT) domain
MSEVLEADACADDMHWAGLSFRVIDDEELARQQAEVEDRVHYHRGVWWRHARALFWLPSARFTEVDHDTSWPHPLKALVGYMHIAKPGSTYNGYFRAIVRERMSSYSISMLAHDTRKKVRKGLTQLQVRPVEHLDQFLSDGFDVYRSWHGRVQWGRDKSSFPVFEGWMSRVFRSPHQLVLGVYLKNRMVAFTLPYAVQNVATTAFIASHSDFLSYNPNDVMFHAFMCIARQTRGVEMVEFGPVSRKPTLDSFKLKYAYVKEFRSYTWINPLVLVIAHQRIREQFPWLNADSLGEQSPAI